MSGQAGRYQRSTAGLVGAMLILLVVIAGFVALRAIFRDDPEQPVQAVDYHQTLSVARERAGFPVLAPQRLPQGWRATTVEFRDDPVHWHLGVLTDRDSYVGVEQAPSSTRSMLETYVDPAPTRDGTARIAGETWQTWSDDGGDLAFVRKAGDVTTLVVGTADRDVLVNYIESLQ